MTDMTENIEVPSSTAGLHSVPHESPDQNAAPHIAGQGLPTNAEDRPPINSEWIRPRLNHWRTGLRDPDLLPGLYRNQEGRLCRLPISADERKQALFDISFADPLSEDNVLIQENISVRRFRHLEYLSILHYQNELLATQLEVERANGFTSDEQMINVRRVLKEYHSAIHDFREFDSIDLLSSKTRLDTAMSAANRFGENGYISSHGALDFFNLKPTKRIDDRLVASLARHVTLPLMNALRTIAGRLPWVRRTPTTRKEALRRLYILRQDLDRETAIHLLDATWQQEQKLQEDIARVLLAIAGSSTLLVPMIVLSFVRPLHYRLITVCVSVVLFSVVVMTISKANVSQLVSISAAYTAVLVVYVGSSSP